MVNGANQVTRVRPDIKPLAGESFQAFALRRQRILQTERVTRSLLERQREQREFERRTMSVEQRRIAEGPAQGVFTPSVRTAELRVTAGAPSEVEVGGETRQVISLPGGGLGVRIDGEIVRISPPTVTEVTPPTRVERARARAGLAVERVEEAIGRPQTIAALEREAEQQELRVEQLKREGRPIRARIQQVSAVTTRAQLGAERAVGVRQVATVAAFAVPVGVGLRGIRAARAAVPAITARIAPRAPRVAAAIPAFTGRGLALGEAAVTGGGVALLTIRARQFTGEVRAAPSVGRRAEIVGAEAATIATFGAGIAGARRIGGIRRPPVRERVRQVIQPRIRVAGVARIERVSPMVTRFESKLLGTVEGEPFLAIARGQVAPPRGRIIPFRAIGIRFQRAGFGRAVTRVGEAEPQVTRFQLLAPTPERLRRAGFGVVTGEGRVPTVTIGRTVVAKRPLFRVRTPEGEIKVREAAFRALGLQRFARRPRLRARPIEGPFRLVEIDRFPREPVVPRLPRLPRAPTTIQRQREVTQLANIQAAQIKQVVKQFRAPRIATEARVVTGTVGATGVGLQSRITPQVQQRLRESTITQQFTPTFRPQVQFIAPRQIQVPEVRVARLQVVGQIREPREITRQRPVTAVAQRFISDQERRFRQVAGVRQAQQLRQRQEVITRVRPVTTTFVPPVIVTPTIPTRIRPPIAPTIFKLPDLERAPPRFQPPRRERGILGVGVRTPSLTAIARGIRSRTREDKRFFTGLELRPIQAR